VSVYPLMLDGTAIRALVVGGGPVAARKARALLDAGAQVRVVARSVAADLRSAVPGALEKSYEHSDIDDATLIVAATDDAALNARIADEARARGILVNVADAPDLGTCSTPAVHRSGDVVIAVSAGGVPTAARRIRDAIARLIDERYATAVADLATLRRTLLDSGRRERWHEAAEALTAADFHEQVESGRYAERVARWR